MGNDGVGVVQSNPNNGKNLGKPNVITYTAAAAEEIQHKFQLCTLLQRVHCCLGEGGGGSHVCITAADEFSLNFRMKDHVIDFNFAKPASPTDTPLSDFDRMENPSTPFPPRSADLADVGASGAETRSSDCVI